MRKIGFFLFLCVLVSTAAIVSFGQMRSVTVSGRAVDDRGQPLQDAIITIYDPPCRDCIDNLLPSAHPLEDGVFFITSENIAVKMVKLFVERRSPGGFWPPFEFPPYTGRLAHLPQFRGRTIRLRKIRTKIDLGDVPVRPLYCKAPIELSRIFAGGKGYDRETLKSLKMWVRDGRGRPIYDDASSLPDVAFNKDLTSLNLAMPIGRWILEFLLDEGNNSAQLPRFSVSVNGCQKVSIVEAPQMYKQR